MQRRDFLFGMLTATAALAVTRTAVAQPTPAGALPTPVYLNMATKGGLFLENTARDAYDKTSDPRIKKFSRAEVIEQVTLSQKLGPFAEAAAGGRMAPSATGPGGLVGGLVAAPLAVAGGVAGAAVGVAGGVVGGALGVPPGTMTTDEQKAQLLSRLSAMQPGPDYDAAFVAASLQGHQEAYSIHGTYAETGEDPALRRIARGALPLLRLHISQLSRLQGRSANLG